MRGYLRIFMIVAGILATSSVACSNSIDIAKQKESQTQDSAGNDSDPYASRIPIDFSMVGYRASDKAIPDIPVTAIVEAPADGSDATSLIQKALDNAPTPGTVLLKAGTYNISGSLKLSRSGIVLRGESDSTVLIATGKTQRSLISIGSKNHRSIISSTNITDSHIPAGQMWIRVRNPYEFKIGDQILIHFYPNEQWIEDLKMDKIAQNSSNSVTQWTPSAFQMQWERTVTDLRDGKVWLDQPVVMELDSKYSREMQLQKVSQERIEECGVENLLLVSEYEKGNDTDENHAWTAVEINSAEHSWVRNIRSKHFGFALVNINKGAKYITVRDCISTEPVSIITGSRRYAFCISGGEMCLIQGCTAENDRHGFVTGAKVPGPNVFLDCVMKNAHNSMGPHHRWASGILYDNCMTDGLIEVQDRAGYGTGHGWAGVNVVYWNCTGKEIVCQNPWISGRNWCVGCKGKKVNGRKYKDGIIRQDGEWLSHGTSVEPQSLYRIQKHKRGK